MKDIAGRKENTGYELGLEQSDAHAGDGSVEILGGHLGRDEMRGANDYLSLFIHGSPSPFLFPRDELGSLGDRPDQVGLLGMLLRTTAAAARAGE